MMTKNKAMKILKRAFVFNFVLLEIISCSTWLTVNNNKLFLVGVPNLMNATLNKLVKMGQRINGLVTADNGMKLLI